MLTRDTVATQHRARLASLHVHQSRTQLPVPNMIVSGLQSSSRCFRPALVSPVLPQQLLRTRVGARPLQQLHAAASAARAAAEVVRTTPAAAEAVIPTILDTMGEVSLQPWHKAAQPAGCGAHMWYAMAMTPFCTAVTCRQRLVGWWVTPAHHRQPWLGAP